jgi:GNAT superfamily N-acetyltransferase
VLKPRDATSDAFLGDGAPRKMKDHMSSEAFHVMLPAGVSQEADFVLRRPAPSDITGVAALFSEMQSYYGQPVCDDEARQAATVVCRPCVHDFDPRAIIALCEGVVVGSAVMNVSFPAYALSRSLYIRDLYVADAMRRRGVGQALVRRAAQLAFSEGFSALEWTTVTANSGARRMYEGCGANRLDRTYYRLTEGDLKVAAHNTWSIFCADKSAQ